MLYFLHNNLSKHDSAFCGLPAKVSHEIGVLFLEYEENPIRWT